MVYGYGFLQFMFQKEFIFHEELCLTDCITDCQLNASELQLLADTATVLWKPEGGAREQN